MIPNERREQSITWNHIAVMYVLTALALFLGSQFDGFMSAIAYTLGAISLAINTFAMGIKAGWINKDRMNSKLDRLQAWLDEDKTK